MKTVDPSGLYARTRRVGVAFSLLLVGCGSASSAPITGCPEHAGPTLIMGTGANAFEPITDGMRLRMATGIQGGCHFWVSVRTDGFAPTGFEIRYEIFDALSGQSTGSTFAREVQLTPAVDAPGQCEYVGYTAFIRSPSAIYDTRVRIDVDVKDSHGRTAAASHEVVADWPQDNAALCMSL